MNDTNPINESDDFGHDGVPQIKSNMSAMLGARASIKNTYLEGLHGDERPKKEVRASKSKPKDAKLDDL